MMPTSPKTRAVEVNVPEEILRYFECEGEDCESRINSLLSEYVEAMMQERDA